MEKKLILVINPGSTSTKVAVFNGYEEVFTDNVSHDVEKLKQYKNIFEQYDLRYKEVISKMKEKGIEISDLKAVVGRGGLLRPLASGIYEVNDNMINYVKEAKVEEHASNLGCVIAKEIANLAGIKAYISDPVVVDEFEDIARITGLPEYPKTSRFHALNHKAMGRRAGKELNKSYFDLNLIIAHLGGGISVAAHNKGRVIDVNEALYGDGPFSPERAGKIPTGSMMDMCFKEGASLSDVKRRIVGNGGLAAHCNTNDARVIEARIDAGDKETELIYKAMAYQVAKEIGSMAVVLKGKVDAVIITGGIAHSKMLVNWIKDWVGFIAPAMVYAGENEMTALAEAGNRILDGQEVAKQY